jgi:hypothetical protein
MSLMRSVATGLKVVAANSWKTTLKPPPGWKNAAQNEKNFWKIIQRPLPEWKSVALRCRSVVNPVKAGLAKAGVSKAAVKGHLLVFAEVEEKVLMMCNNII